MLKWISLYSPPSPQISTQINENVPHQRWGHASLVVDKCLYIIGGFDGIFSIFTSKIR